MALPFMWLPAVLRAAGLKVALVDGWETRGTEKVGKTLGVICHHTATVGGGNMPTLGLLIKGREDLKGPLCQLGLGRDGTFYIVAAGRANHAGPGSWMGIVSGNSSFIGIEAENSGSKSDPWPDVQIDAYQRGVAAILAHIGRTAASCCGHKEYALPAGRKTDPDIDMNAFRDRVAKLLNNEVAPIALIPAAEPTGKARRTMRRGDNGPDVVELQRALDVETNGVFGPKTEAAVREFQRTHNMVPDGIVGPKSWAAIDAARPVLAVAGASR